MINLEKYILKRKRKILHSQLSAQVNIDPASKYKSTNV